MRGTHEFNENWTTSKSNDSTGYGSGYDILSTEFKRNLNFALANVPRLRWWNLNLFLTRFMVQCKAATLP